MGLESYPEALRVEAFKGVLGCVFALIVLFSAYRGGPVRYGTIPMPDEGRVVMSVCGVLIFVYSLKRLLIVLMR